MFIISVYHHYERFLCCYKYEVYDSPAAGAGVQCSGISIFRDELIMQIIIDCDSV